MNHGSNHGGGPGEKLKVLLVEDDPVDKELVLRALRNGGFDPEADTADDREKFVACIEKKLLSNHPGGLWPADLAGR